MLTYKPIKKYKSWIVSLLAQNWYLRFSFFYFIMTEKILLQNLIIEWEELNESLEVFGTDRVSISIDNYARFDAKIDLTQRVIDQ